MTNWPVKELVSPRPSSVIWWQTAQLTPSAAKLASGPGITAPSGMFASTWPCSPASLAP